MQTKKKPNRVLVAFPGMGKTTYALSHPGTIDLDFGNFRSALQVSKDKEGTILVPFSRLIKYYYKDGYNVLTNDPKLIPLAKQFATVEVVLPLNLQEHVARVQQREKLRHVNTAFPIELEQHIDEWVEDWNEIANRYQLKVHFVKYLKEVM